MRKLTTQIAVRYLFADDYPAVAEVERLSYPFPWGVADLRDFLRMRGCFGQVAVVDGRVVGHALYEAGRRRIWLAALAVHPHYRRRGVGAALMGRLADKLSPRRRKRIVADCPDDALPGHLFLRSLGFRAVRVLRGGAGDLYRFFLRAKEG
jgi:ribosomal protein S18 acetylase RimI-like enzyme